MVYLYLPTGLDALTVDVSIGKDIKLPLDLLDSSSLAEVNGILSGMGKELIVPGRGEKGKLKFDISPFLEMLDSNNSFRIKIRDKNKKEDQATIVLNKK